MSVLFTGKKKKKIVTLKFSLVKKKNHNNQIHNIMFSVAS